ncbi:elongation factor P 5-aminopentanone reductase [Sutcliffiella horikoshii]|uniref:elongation factor P 5-aminopentanone reductase n=1 Tax=Sutcliffiella horikoshii TaxID=79883 RepID=UPI001F271F32|nr:SDR family oxidoreductase [Sutcliffiella horikoshii]MCG1020711.1 SDR family oxidoreductase [Sutcliffiella horikoshii]
MSRTALIIGASGDIGKEIAKTLLAEGYTTYLHYNQDKKTILELMDEYGTEKITPIQSDLTEEMGVQLIKENVFSTIDTIVYNAGFTYYGLMTDIDEKTKRKMVSLNIISLYSTIQAFLPEMIKKRNGNIVIISSIWGEIGASCEVLYSMTKGAQISFVKALAKEVALNGVRVNAIAPGAVATKMLESFSEEEKMEISADIPMGRLASPHEIADSVSFLLSKRSSYITGQVLGVNGGWN